MICLSKKSTPASLGHPASAANSNPYSHMGYAAAKHDFPAAVPPGEHPAATVTSGPSFGSAPDAPYQPVEKLLHAPGNPYSDHQGRALPSSAKISAPPAASAQEARRPTRGRLRLITLAVLGGAVVLVLAYVVTRVLASGLG